MKRSTSRNLGAVALAAMAVFLVVAPVPSFAHEQGAPQRTASLTLTGGMVDAGRHRYTSQGGKALFAAVLGETLDPATTSFSYWIGAEVDGQTVTGSASFQLSGVTAAGEAVSATGTMRLNEIRPVPAEEFPVGCQTDCTSEIPAFYLGVARVDLSLGGAVQDVAVPMAFESAFLNPFGGPIIVASLDGGATVSVVTTYTRADIHWLGVDLQGTIGGTMAGRPVSGQFTILSAARDENLLTGTETESGTMTFSHMSVPSLDASGTYHGTSTIPAAGEVDCSYLTGVPGTCTETGFSSQGTFSLFGSRGEGTSLSGAYQVQWGVPALGFTGTATATLSQYPRGR